MSPAVNVDLEEVPFAILEAVKARILANRRRLDQALAKPRVPTRPRPQFRKFGASSKSWRKPQYAAGIIGEGGFLLRPPSAYVNSTLSVVSDEYAPLVFSRFDSISTQSYGLAYEDFDIVQGPVAGTYALAPRSGVLSLGYVYLSDFAEDTPVNLRKVSDSVDSNREFIEFGLAQPRQFTNTFPSVFPEVVLPRLRNPRATASAFQTFTLEFLYKSGGAYLAVEMNNLYMYFGTDGEGVDLMYVLLSGITAVTGGKGDLLVGSEVFSVDLYNEDPAENDFALPDATSDGWRHVAICKSANSIGFYVSGRRIFTATTSSNYWNRYSVCGSPDPPETDGSLYVVDVGTLPLIVKLRCPGNAAIGPRAAVHGLRFSSEALYTSESFTPPTSITALA